LINPITQFIHHWLNYVKGEMFFWTYEWDKHGTCSNMQLLDFFKPLNIYARNDLKKILKDKINITKRYLL